MYIRRNQAISGSSSNTTYVRFDLLVVFASRRINPVTAWLCISVGLLVSPIVCKRDYSKKIRLKFHIFEEERSLDKSNQLDFENDLDPHTHLGLGCFQF